MCKTFRNKQGRMPCRLLALVCTLALLVCSLALLVGCATSGMDDSGTDATSSQSSAALSTTEQVDSLQYTTESDLTETITMARCWGVTEKGKIWTYGKLLPDLDKDGDGYAIVWLDAHGSCQRRILFTLPTAPAPPQGGTVQQDVGAVYLGEGDTIFAVVQQHTWTEDPHTGQQAVSDFALTLCCPDEDGTLRPQTQLALPKQLAEDVSALELLPGGAFATADGCWLLLARQQDNALDCWLAHYTADGSYVQALQLGQNVLQVRPLSASQALFVAGTGGTDYALYTVDDLDAPKATVTRQEFAPLRQGDPSLMPCVLSAMQENGSPLLVTEQGVWQWQRPADPVLSWQEHGLQVQATPLQCVVALDADTLVAVTQRDGSAPYCFHMLDRKQTGQAEGREVLTLGLTIPGDVPEELQYLVFQYNSSNDQYYLQTVDYSDTAAQAAGFSSGLEMLQKDILHDTAPDILMLPHGFTDRALLSNGYFINLYPYLDADQSLQRSDFLPNVLRLCEYNGALTTVITGFRLSTIVGSPELLGATPGWGWDEFNALCAANPQTQSPIYNQDRDTFVCQQVLLEEGRYLDHQTHTCHLETPEFMQLLETSTRYQDETQTEMFYHEGLKEWYASVPDPKSAFAEGSTCMKEVSVGNFREPLIWQYELDGDFVCKGHPSDTGSGNSLLPSEWWGITSYCQHPDAAWAFLRLILLPDYQNTTSLRQFSLRKDVLQAAAKAASQPLPFVSYLPGYLDRYSLTEEQQAYWKSGVQSEQCDKVMAAIESADTLFLWDTTVSDILIEELTAFYNGQRTAAETAKIMQDRVQTYLDEQS